MVEGLASNGSSVKTAMINSEKFKFFLTGSRYFKNNKPESDWDFFTEQKEGVTDFLSNIGFIRLAFNSYRDQETICVYRNKLERVDIQIVQNAELKRLTQEYLYAHADTRRLLQTLPKGQRTVIWDFAFRLMKGMNTPSGDRYIKEEKVLPDLRTLLAGFGGSASPI
jgi:hypothetical protein